MMTPEKKLMNQQHQQQYQDCNQVTEGLESGDLSRLVTPVVTIDEFKSKMGPDEDIVVISLKIKYKDPALDLVNFVEKGYDWVADADVSAGELDDGSYMVFIEAEREPDLPNKLIALFDDLIRLTGIKMDEWKVTYYKPHRSGEMTAESLAKLIPGTPEAYKNLMRKQQTDIDQLKTAAGVKVTTLAPKNDYTESLRVMAGLR